MPVTCLSHASRMKDSLTLFVSSVFSLLERLEERSEWGYKLEMIERLFKDRQHSMAVYSATKKAIVQRVCIIM